MSLENEQRYFDALKRITLYQSVERLRRSSENDWGVEFPESLEYAYENVIHEAHTALRGRRRPKLPGERAAKPDAQTAVVSPSEGNTTDDKGDSNAK